MCESPCSAPEKAAVLQRPIYQFRKVSTLLRRSSDVLKAIERCLMKLTHVNRIFVAWRMTRVWYKCI